jgi:lipopolysaccharide assembly outer membrane protein LptD (OstA)
MTDSNNRRHPESTFEAEYPYNQSTITRSGHEIHINDTPNKESLRIAHTKGSYIEIDKEGSTRVNSVGKAYYYICDGFTTTVDGHYDLKIKGVMNVNVDGSVSEQTSGDRNMSAGKNFKYLVGGVLTEIIGGDKNNSVAGKHTTTIKGNDNKSVEGKSVTQIDGRKTEILKDDWFVTSKGNIEIVSDGSIRFKCKNFEIEADSITLKTIAGDVTINSSSQVISTSIGQTIVTASKIILNG